MTTDTTTEITEGDWKTLATTEITHLTDEEKDYLPRAWDEWIARVRRDAAREALDELVATQEYGAKLAHGKDEAEARIKAVRAIHRDLYESMSGVPYCVECDRAWPCPTVAALTEETP